MSIHEQPPRQYLMATPVHQAIGTGPAADILAGRARNHPAMTQDAGQATPVRIQLLEPTANLGLTELHVIPGVIDEHARELFLYAQCQMLALAIHEQTGWPLWVAEQQLPSGTWAWVHVAVQTPDGRWLDIDGPRDAQEVTGWISAGWGLPVRLRLRLLDDPAEWHVMLGRPASTPATWWRTQITSSTGIALTETFARLALTSC